MKKPPVFFVISALAALTYLPSLSAQSIYAEHPFASTALDWSSLDLGAGRPQAGSHQTLSFGDVGKYVNLQATIFVTQNSMTPYSGFAQRSGLLFDNDGPVYPTTTNFTGPAEHSETGNPQWLLATTDPDEDQGIYDLEFLIVFNQPVNFLLEQQAVLNGFMTNSGAAQEGETFEFSLSSTSDPSTWVHYTQESFEDWRDVNAMGAGKPGEQRINTNVLNTSDDFGTDVIDFFGNRYNQGDSASLFMATSAETTQLMVSYRVGDENPRDNSHRWRLFVEDFAVVPEPATSGLLLILGAMGLMQRKR
ncbi:MAG: PEP-CTERM sorting domain-containing protein [Verrucomicrobiales bacterium]